MSIPWDGVPLRVEGRAECCCGAAAAEDNCIVNPLIARAGSTGFCAGAVVVKSHTCQQTKNKEQRALRCTYA